LKGQSAITHRPGEKLLPANLEATRAKLKSDLKVGVEDNEDELVDDEDLNGYLMYPKVFIDYRTRHRLYGPVRTLPTRTFFYGMEPGEQISVEIDPGKRLEIVLQTVSATLETGDVKVYFELNGQPREIRVPNRSAKARIATRPKADDTNRSHVGAPMPGLVIGVKAAPGQELVKGDVILQIEAMKMQTAVTADRAGALKAIHVKIGDQIDVKDLLAEFE
jgi:pyruvate carboxylase